MLSSPLERDKSLKAAAAERYDDTTTTITITTTDGESVRTVEAWNAMLERTRTEEEEEEEEEGWWCVTRTRGRMMGRERSECGDRQAARRTFSTLDSRERDKERRENDRNEWPNLALFGGEGGGERHSRTPRGETRQPRTHTYTYIYILTNLLLNDLFHSISLFLLDNLPLPLSLYIEIEDGWRKKKGWAGSAEVVDNEDDDSKDDLTAQPVSNLMTELGPSGPPALFLPSISHARSSRDPPRIPRSEIRLSLSLSYSSR